MNNRFLTQHLLTKNPILRVVVRTRDKKSEHIAFEDIHYQLPRNFVSIVLSFFCLGWYITLKYARPRLRPIAQKRSLLESIMGSDNLIHVHRFDSVKWVHSKKNERCTTYCIPELNRLSPFFFELKNAVVTRIPVELISDWLARHPDCQEIGQVDP